MSLLAHTGNPIHGVWDALVHPFTGADHLLAMAGVAIGATFVVVKLRSVRTARRRVDRDRR